MTSSLTTLQQVQQLFDIAKRSGLHALRYRDSAGTNHFFIQLPTHQAHYFATPGELYVRADTPSFS